MISGVGGPYAYKPVKILKEKQRNSIFAWSKDKHKTTYLDDSASQSKKDCQQAPNAYFPNPGKEKELDFSHIVPKLMFSTKKSRVSQMKKVSIVEEIIKNETQK